MNTIFQEQIQWLEGQWPRSQLSRHHASIRGFPAKLPVALHPLVGPPVGDLDVGAAVAGPGVVPTTVIMGVSGMGSCVKGGWVMGSSVEGAGPPAGMILISAQFTNVSCLFASPSPQTPSSLQPQLLPTVHHHCITHLSHVRPLGSRSLILNSPFVDEWSGQVLEPSGCNKTCFSCSWVMGRFSTLPKLKRKNPWWFDVIFTFTSICCPSLYVFVMKPSFAYLPG